MIINRYQLRMLVESVLLEGFKDDQRYLIEKYPDRAQDLSRLQSKWIAWLTARFGESPRAEETHPFEDTIVTVLNFSRKDAAIGEKYRSNEQFRTAIDSRFPPATRSWNSPSDPTAMTVDEMETVLALSERKKQRIEVNEAESIEGDRVGKVGPWNLWLPTTREKSCKIAQYDPVTMEPKTTWCTARTSGSNLFYNYIGSPNADVTLFYAIKDDPKSNSDWVSVGFVNGKPTLEGQDGGLSVDRANKGLTPVKLKKILGPDHDEIMMKFTEKNKSLGGKHPAREKIISAAQNIQDFDYVIKGVSKDEASDIMSRILREKNVSDDVLVRMFDKGNTLIRSRIAGDARRHLPDELVSKAASDPEVNVRYAISAYFRNRNRAMPPEIALKLWNDTEMVVKYSVANHPAIPEKEINDYFRDLAQSKNREDRKLAAGALRDPVLLSKLARDRSDEVRVSVAENQHTPPDVLIRLLNDKKESVSTNAIQNESLPIETIVLLSSDPDPIKRRNVVWNRRTPPEVLSKLSRDPDPDVRLWVARHPNTPVEALRVMLNDVSPLVASEAKENLGKRKQSLAESQLRQLIRHML